MFLLCMNPFASTDIAYHKSTRATEATFSPMYIFPRNRSRTIHKSYQSHQSQSTPCAFEYDINSIFRFGAREFPTDIRDGDYVCDGDDVLLLVSYKVIEKRDGYIKSTISIENYLLLTKTFLFLCW